MNLTTKGLIHLFHYIDNLRGGSRHLYNKFEAHTHNLIGVSRMQPSCHTIKDKLVRTKSRTRLSNETLEKWALDVGSVDIEPVGNPKRKV